MAQHVLAAVDDSPASEAAVEFVAEEWPAATVVLLHAIDPKPGYTAVAAPAKEWYDRERERAAALLDETADRLPADATTDTIVEVGRPATTIVDTAASEDVDHIVVGSHGREGVSRVLLGSVAERVARRAAVPVTVVR